MQKFVEVQAGAVLLKELECDSIHIEKLFLVEVARQVKHFLLNEDWAAAKLSHMLLLGGPSDLTLNPVIVLVDQNGSHVHRAIHLVDVVQMYVHSLEASENFTELVVHIARGVHREIEVLKLAPTTQSLDLVFHVLLILFARLS